MHIIFISNFFGWFTDQDQLKNFWGIQYVFSSAMVAANVAVLLLNKFVSFLWVATPVLWDHLSKFPKSETCSVKKEVFFQMFVGHF